MSNYTGKKDELTPILNFSFPSTSVFNISLIKIVNQNFSDFKERHFAFLNMVPGVGSGNDRKYDNNQKLTIKASLREISSLSFTLEQCSRGLSQTVLPYTKFANSGGGSKQISVWISTTNDNQTKINLTFTENQNNKKFNISLSPSEAYGVSAILSKVFEYGMNLEIDYQKTKPKYQNSNQNTNINNQQNNQVSFNVVDNNQDHFNNSSFDNNQDQFNNSSFDNNQDQFNNSQFDSKQKQVNSSPFDNNIDSNNNFDNQMDKAINGFENMFKPH